MNPIRLSLRFLFCVLGLPFMPVIALICLVSWAMTSDGADVYDGTLGPWLRNLRHPLT